MKFHQDRPIFSTTCNGFSGDHFDHFWESNAEFCKFEKMLKYDYTKQHNENTLSDIKHFK